MRYTVVVVKQALRTTEKALGSWLSISLSLVLLILMVDEHVSRAAATLFYRVSPVTQHWTPLRVWSAEGDVYVLGMAVKRHGCKYISPPRAFGDNNTQLVVVSGAMMPNANLPSGPQPYPFGPWRVVGGATHKRLTFQYEHECSPGVRVFSKLGTLAAPYVVGTEGYHN